MKKMKPTILLLFSLLLPSCSPLNHTIFLPPNLKFLDGEIHHNKLKIQTRPANNKPAEIILFQDGRGNDFIIYEN